MARATRAAAGAQQSARGWHPLAPHTRTWLAKVTMRLVSGSGTGNKWFRMLAHRAPSALLNRSKMRCGHASLTVPTTLLSPISSRSTCAACGGAARGLRGLPWCALQGSSAHNEVPTVRNPKAFGG